MGSLGSPNPLGLLRKEQVLATADKCGAAPNQFHRQLNAWCKPSPGVQCLFSHTWIIINMSANRIAIDFIHSPYSQAPGTGGSASRHRVHSHAAREAHARVRRQRLVEYQATGIASEDSEEARTEFAATDKFDASLAASPVELLAAGRRDPFGSFARRLNSMEDFLLDYCK